MEELPVLPLAQMADRHYGLIEPIAESYVAPRVYALIGIISRPYLSAFRI